MIIIETCPQCGHDLHDEVICTYPPIPRKLCSNCGWSWEGKPEEVVRIPFQYNYGKKIDGAKENIMTPEQLQDIKERLTEVINIREWPMQPSNAAFEQSVCVNCPTNPKNGGDGVCFCILGQQTIY